VRFAVGLFEEAIDFPFGVALFRFVVEFFAHTPLENHFARDFASGVEIARSAIRGRAIEDALGGASAHKDDQFFQEEVLALDVLIFVREQSRDAEGLAARNDADLVKWWQE